MHKSLAVVAVLSLFVVGNLTAAPVGRASGAVVDTMTFGGELGSIRPARTGPWRTSANAMEAARVGDDAASFARGFAARLGGSGTESFEARRVVNDDMQQTHVRVQQQIAGLAVIGADLIVHADARTGNVLGVNGRFVPDRGLPRRPAVNAGAAIENAVAEYGIADFNVVGVPELLYVIGENDSIHLAWSNLIAYVDADGDDQLDRVFADAITGDAVDRHPQYHRAKYRKTYTCSNGTTLPGTLLFNEGGSSSDTTAMAAYNNAGKTYDYYYTKHARDSYDGAGATMHSSVHYSTNYNNAFWNGSQMVYGDGDGTTFTSLAKSLDVVAHELTHAVTEKTAGLVYKNESGALNEGMSDIFGAATEIYNDGGINSATWLIGDEIYTPATAGDALRYMDDPAKGGDYDYYPTRYIGTSDNGGVHWNSGIANLAFKLLVTGGTHPRSKTSTAVTGIGIAQAEKIFYRALDVYSTSSTNFRVMRDYTLRAASDLYGSTSTAYAQVANAWTAVGNDWTRTNTSITTAGGNSYSAQFTSSTSGYHTGYLFGPSTADFDLYLQKWNATYSRWDQVASGATAAANETVQYNGTAGTYRWRVHAYSGTGTYNVYGNKPK
jgi:vibriolysin